MQKRKEQVCFKASLTPFKKNSFTLLILGLVATHAYAVLDVRTVNEVKEKSVK